MCSKVANVAEDVKPFVWSRIECEERSLTLNNGSPTAEHALQARVAEVEQRLQAEVARVRQSAFEEGTRQARNEAAREIAAASDRLAQHLKEIQTLKRRIRDEAEAEVVRLALAIAHRIMHRELMLDPDSIQGILHAAMRKLQQREIIRLRVHSSAVPSIRTAIQRAGVGDGVEILADPAMSVGDLIVETTRGELDASVGTQLQEIARGFADRLALP